MCNVMKQPLGAKQGKTKTVVNVTSKPIIVGDKLP